MRFPPARAVGTLDSIAHDSVFIHAERGGATAFHLPSADRFEKSLTGKRSAPIRKGLLAGIVAGAALGALYGASGSGSMDPTASSSIMAGFVAVPGALLGAIIGGSARERWERVGVVGQR